MEEENKVLVLCQRRSGTDQYPGVGQVEETTIPLLKRYLSTLVSSPKIEYLSPGLLKEQKSDVDYKMRLGNNPESDALLSTFRGTFKVIVFQTCAVNFLTEAIPYVYDLLKKDGIVVFTLFPNPEPIINLSNYTHQEQKKFIDDFNRYFELAPMSSTIYIKRSKIIPMSADSESRNNAASADFGKRKKSKSRKRKSSKRKSSKIKMSRKSRKRKYN
jgi:hypothetical protein